MMLRAAMLTALLALLPVVATAHDEGAKTAGRPPEKLGTVHFPTSCDAAVQPLFERGVALLHSFWFPEGLKTFNEVLKRDPSCTIAYWGIAVNRLLNPFGGAASEATLLQGQEAIEKGLAAGAKTERERDYLAAIGAFYGRDHASFRERVTRYEAAMEKLAAKYPQDKEASIFYALALNIAADPMDKTFARQLKAARILEPIFAEQPEHPGVAHYLIHSYDYPPIAQKRLPFARGYGAARLGDAAGAASEAAALGRLKQELDAQKDKYWGTEVEAQRLAVSAWAAFAGGERDAALSLMRSAADLEDSSEKSPVSPGRLVPARELLGELLLALDRPADAPPELERAAQRDPNRFRGYYGAALAAQRAGDARKAREYFSRLAQLGAKGDARPELQQARTFLAVR